MRVSKYLFLIILVSCLAGCSSDERIDNPFLPNVAVNFTANLNLPQFSNLEFPGSTVVVQTDGIGIKGIIIHNVNGSLFTAFELSDPNHSPNECSSQSVEGIVASCNCLDGNSYDIITGQPQSSELPYGLKPYRAELQGSSIFISN